MNILPLLTLAALLLPAAAADEPAAAADAQAPRNVPAPARDAQAAPSDGKDMESVIKKVMGARPDAVGALLDTLPDLDAGTEEERITLMHAAIACGRADIVHALLERGADPETIMKPGLTPLAIAAIKNDTDSIDLLLRHGAKVDSVTPAGFSALKLACAEGMLDAVQVLLAHRADPNLADARGETALARLPMTKADALGICRALLDHGAKPDVHDSKRHWTPLMNAVMACNGEVAGLLLDKGAGVNFKGGVENDSSPLMVAAGTGLPAMTRLLLERGADPRQRDKDGNDALDAAVSGNRFILGLIATLDSEHPLLRKAELVDALGACRLLLEHGATVNHADQVGDTPLIIAARAAAPEVVAFLLSRKADPNAANAEGRTALIAAVQPVADKVTHTFRTEDVDPAQLVERFSTLFEAPDLVRETVRVLLEGGADPGARDASGRRAVDYVSDPELIRLLTPETEKQAQQP